MNFSIYPNPNTGDFTIQSATFLNMYIHNLSGQLVHKQLINSGRNEIKLDLNKGVYLTEFITDGVKMHRKIIIL